MTTFDNPPPTEAPAGDVRAFAQGIRQIVLEQSKRAGVGHIGSALSDRRHRRRALRGDARHPSIRATRIATGSSFRRATRPRALRGAPLRDVADRSTSSRPTATDGTLLGTHPEAGVRGRRLLDRLAGSRSVARRPGPRSRRASSVGETRVLFAQRRRVQRGLGLGGGHVRGAPPPGQSRRDRRPERAAGARLHEGRARSVPDGRSLACVRLGRARSGRPRPMALADAIARLDTPAGHRTCSSRTRCSARVSPTWRARSSGTTWPMTDEQYERRS